MSKIVPCTKDLLSTSRTQFDNISAISLKVQLIEIKLFLYLKSKITLIKWEEYKGKNTWGCIIKKYMHKSLCIMPTKNEAECTST